MNAKTAKRIRQLARVLYQDLAKDEDATVYHTKAHKPRFTKVTRINPSTDRAEIVPFRLNTDQKIIRKDCFRGVVRLMKKVRKNPASAGLTSTTVGNIVSKAA